MKIAQRRDRSSAKPRSAAPRDRHDLLVELGCEELPPKFCLTVEESAPRLIQHLAEKGVRCSQANSYCTPRRIVYYLKDLKLDMDLLEREVLGPPKHVGTDAAGKLTRAGEGFAQKIGRSASEIYIKVTGRGVYLAGKLKFSGSLESILKENLPPFLLSLADASPKRMKWGSEPVSFVRPMRWLVALLDSRVLRIAVGSVAAGNSTCPIGARSYLSPKRAAIDDPGEFVRGLGKALQRRKLFDESKYEFEEDLPRVFEWPELGRATYSEKFHDLPQVMVDAIIVHQMKCMKLKGGKPGEFAFAAEGPLTPASRSNLRNGYQTLAEARLTDAHYFFHKDMQRPLHERIELLKSIQFLEGYGTVFDKSKRLDQIATEVNGLLRGFAPEEALHRAAHLCRADQTTAMVREITDLEGIMGGIYAERSGESKEVAAAIRESYLPRGARDDVPASRAGIVLSLADKIDNLLCFFSTKIRPTGSKDPLGFRRNASGILRTVEANSLHLPMEEAFRLTATVTGNGADRIGEIKTFMEERFSAYIRERHPHWGFDLVETALPHAFRDPYYAIALCHYLHHEKEKGDLHFFEVRRIAERIHNLSAQGGDGVPAAPDESRFTMDEEKAMAGVYHALARLRETTMSVVTLEVSRRLSTFVNGITADQIASADTFFDHVLVMDPDPAVRQNRLSLLRAIDALFADFGNLAKLEWRKE